MFDEFIRRRMEILPKGPAPLQLYLSGIKILQLKVYTEYLDPETNTTHRPHGMLLQVPAGPIYGVELRLDDTLEEWAITIGHELCHSLEREIDDWECFIETFSNHVGDPFEHLCDEFSFHWLEQGGNYKWVIETLTEEFLRGGKTTKDPLAANDCY